MTYGKNCGRYKGRHIISVKCKYKNAMHGGRVSIIMALTVPK